MTMIYILLHREEMRRLHTYREAQCVPLGYAGTTMSFREAINILQLLLPFNTQPNESLATHLAQRAPKPISSVLGNNSCGKKTGSHFWRLLNFNLLGVRCRVGLGTPRIRLLLFSLLFLLFLFCSQIPSRASVGNARKVKQSKRKKNHYIKLSS